MLHIKIIDSDNDKIQISKAEKFISSSKFGASIYFLGTVRNQNENKSVSGITYDVHDEMVLKLSKIRAVLAPGRLLFAKACCGTRAGPHAR